MSFSIFCKKKIGEKSDREQNIFKINVWKPHIYHMLKNVYFTFFLIMTNLEPFYSQKNEQNLMMVSYWMFSGFFQYFNILIHDIFKYTQDLLWSHSCWSSTWRLLPGHCLGRRMHHLPLNVRRRGQQKGSTTRRHTSFIMTFSRGLII